MPNTMAKIKPDNDWRSWLVRQIAQGEATLATEQERLAGIRAGRRFEVALLGWPDRVSAQEALVHAQREWIEYLQTPDLYLRRFLMREDFGSRAWTSRFNARLTEFFLKHACEPTSERQRPNSPNKRDRAAEIRRWRREHQTRADRPPGDLRAGRWDLRDLR